VIRLAALGIAVLAAACGGGGTEDEQLTVYLKQRLGPEAPRGQVAPVLMPVQRDRRQPFPPPEQVLDQLWRGPSAAERADGFRRTLGGGTKWLGASVTTGVATVRLTGEEPGLYESAAIVYSLTELPGVHAVRLLLEGKPCCVYDHRSRPIRTLTRRGFRGWQGEPCPLRSYRDAVRCSD
jgi:hypothetical protein